MIVNLRPLTALFLTCLLAACASKPGPTIGELPRTPEGNIEQILEQAADSDPEEANPLRLSAADLAYQQKDFNRASSILLQVPLQTLPPAEQIYALTLQAELELQRKKPKSALNSLDHPSFQYLAQLPVEQQIRSAMVRANALQADNQNLAAARERVFIAPLLSGQAASGNHERIWVLVSSLPDDQLAAGSDADLNGWLELVRISRGSISLEQQQAAIDSWRSKNPQHPAAKQLPQPLTEIEALAAQTVTKVGLLLPQEGQLATVAEALRNGFMAAYYQALASGAAAPEIIFYDSSRLTSMDEFYRQAQQDGIQLVVGPLEKPLVRQLNAQANLPITTLALNYSDTAEPGPAQLFQFGLSAEDEAREVARRAWADGMRRAVALVPRGEWGDRTLAAFQQAWLAQGGTLIAAEHVEQPVELAQQIASLFQLRDSEARAKRLQSLLGEEVASQPARRQDIDFIFLAATPQQAQQIKPTLAFQYAGDVPVYATSHLLSGTITQPQPADLNGIRFCETPWLLNSAAPLQQQVIGQWPQAAGSMGRLFAMGSDAYLLTSRLNQLKSLPESNAQGLSGLLSLSQTQRVVRQLQWAEFRDGLVQPL
ncbi:penicillin-binding protein activator [Pseudomonas sp. N040]|uniref:penicillin-binding protein activator n=1 Tax=Pseudomonas sp. N040 TaxID=2785325 RepID=UPI0018A25309|nr:penicillin-binding protein activator [Pseudomonas sp. N040]MBF7730340.1 penicillin-binding protein activator [Pseudomonas sp. N040]MBW7013982.1 penicillin-binding protein activator [Pseudomonas sp. N040]